MEVMKKARSWSEEEEVRVAGGSQGARRATGEPSPVDSPRRYRIGRTSATFGDRRVYGGRIELVKRCDPRRPPAGH